MKPWKKFSPKTAVLPVEGKNTLKKVSFLLRFLWTSKENEEDQSIVCTQSCGASTYP
ncbi:MAG: hypothetical protein R2798_03710 [Chitinophagales bacterium]|nr:hypothetical protein [Chitinophagales bacterium]